MMIQTISDFRRAMRNGPYAWPGGYPCYFLMADGESMSFKAAKENRREMLEAIARPEYRDSGWRPIALDINWEDANMVCTHTNEPIESAYGEVQS